MLVIRKLSTQASILSNNKSCVRVCDACRCHIETIEIRQGCQFLQEKIETNKVTVQPAE